VTEQNVSRFLEGYLVQLSLLLPQVPGRVLPGVVAMLDALRTRKDFAVGLLTGNLVRGAQLKLAHYGLWHHFPFGAFADDHHERNHLGPFAQSRAQAHHGIAFPPEKIWILGDTPHDIACARAIGARALAVATGIFSLDALEPHQPDLLLEDLSEGATLLDTLCSPSAR
jgi:phosphoglycolate phosphatase-like HAD superfamily hydrolase